MCNQSLDRAKWIWCNDKPEADEYGEFYTAFWWQRGKAELQISADSDYAVYLNGTLCAFGQYHDFPYDKVYDTVDASRFCRAGQNHLAIVVWHYGDSNMSYYPGRAALLFQLNGNNGCLVASGHETKARLSRTYQSHRRQKITSQLGFGFAYDATKEDGWMLGNGHGLGHCTLVEQDLPLRPRPCKKLEFDPPRQGMLIKNTAKHTALYDLGANTVGFLRVTAMSASAQALTISYGEHITDGSVRRIIGKRDFSVEVTVRKGETVYLNPFRRLGCRYLEVAGTAPLDHFLIEVLPTSYPVRALPHPVLTHNEQEIYDICVNTLHLCMHEHYEDCPWREQALYCMDSRNQMLCGYYAFGETAFPRANLELISKDDRADGLLAICSPSDTALCIPSFSLHYFTQCAEYLHHSGDEAFLREIYPKLERILQVFLARQNTQGLVPPFAGEGYWNFYEWRNGLDGHKALDISVPDLPLNALLSLALQHMSKIASRLGVTNDYAGRAKQLNRSISNYFYDNKRNLFFDRPTASKTYSVLGNALAVLCGAVTGEAARILCASVIDNPLLTPISLSMQCFLYDALLQVDLAKYRPYVLQKIEQTYRPMVELGLGTVWETEQGESDFKNAGSLCHGWSAMPVYYYHKLK